MLLDNLKLVDYCSKIQITLPYKTGDLVRIKSSSDDENFIYLGNTNEGLAIISRRKEGEDIFGDVIFISFSDLDKV